jgi:hypothetical protein
MINATLQGRRLVLTVSGGDDDPAIEPFVISPLPGDTGRALTADYLNLILGIGNVTEERKAEIFEISLDGVDPATGHLRRDEISGEPLKPNSDRIGQEVTQEEGEALVLAAFMWHTIVGMDGVRAFLNDMGREGAVAAAGKAVRLLTQRLAISPSTTSPNSELGSLIRTPAVTPSTDIPRGGARPGGTLAKLPPGKRSIRQRPASR